MFGVFVNGTRADLAIDNLNTLDKARRFVGLICPEWDMYKKTINAETVYIYHGNKQAQTIQIREV
jgi:hypothetical protein